MDYNYENNEIQIFIFCVEIKVFLSMQKLINQIEELIY